MSVSQNKYDKAKEAAKFWHGKLETILEENTFLKKEVERWKQLSEVLPDPDSIEELQKEAKEQGKAIKALKKQNSETEERYKEKIAHLEREKILHEGKIQQLEEARRDLQERYNELKQDYREQYRWKSGKEA